MAPVGVAWARAHALAPSLQLWGGDDTHPSTAGTYLAACVFYEALTHRSPIGNPYLGGVDPPTAHLLQQIAAATVS